MKKPANKSPKSPGRARNQRVAAKKGRRIDERTLNTNVRSSKINRIQFFRRCRMAVRVLVILLILAGVVAGARILIAKAFYENPQFALSELQVSTDGALTEARILKEANVREGTNLLTVDIENIRAELTKLAQVESVKVERQLPDRLIIQVVERHPIAWLSCPTLGIRAGTSSGGFLLDARGTVIDCEVMLDEYLRFPVIRARSLSRVRPGRIIESDQVLSALQILRKTHQVFDRDQMEIVVMDLPTDYSIQTLFSDGARITFGMDDIDRQIEDLRAIADRFAETDRQIKTLDLMPRKNIPVTFTDGPGIKPIRRQKPKSVVAGSGANSRLRNNPVKKREMAALKKSTGISGESPSSRSKPGAAGNTGTTPAPAPGTTSQRPAATRPDSGQSSKRLKIQRDIQAILREG